MRALREGRIEIDGIDIATVNLKDLRSRITIIPQDPVLFTVNQDWNGDGDGDGGCKKHIRTWFWSSLAMGQWK